MVLFKADKEDITIHVEGDNGEVVIELAGILDAIKEDKRLTRLVAKAEILRALYETMEGEKESDKQSSSDRKIN